MADLGLTVVVAAAQGAEVERCLRALAGQADARTEVMVVSAGPLAHGSGEHPGVAWREAPATHLIPQLWSMGMSEARHDVVAITTTHFEPAADWVAAVRRAHARFPDAGIGGPIDPPEGGGPVNWATFFLRYSAYMVLREEQPVGDLAGDNASYKRVALLAHPTFLENGFWEHEFHQALTAAGGRLRFDPAIRVRQRTSFGFTGFLRQRFAHGLEYGRTRRKGRGAAFRVAAPVLGLAVPFVLLARVCRRVVARPTHLLPFLACLPVLVCFVLAWSTGELLGYLLPRGGPGAVAHGASA